MSPGKHRTLRALAMIIIVATALTVPQARIAWATEDRSELAVSASISTQTLRVGETAVLSITVEGTADCRAPETPHVKNLNIRYVGPSSQVYMADGKVSQSISFRFTVESSKAGTYVIPPVEVRVKTETYKTEPLEIEVIASTSQGRPTLDSRQPDSGGVPANSLRLVLEPEKTTIYPGEEIRVKVILYIDGVRLTGVTYPRLAGAGFLCEEFDQPVQGRTNLDGRTLQTIEFETAVSSATTGELTLGPVSIDCEVNLPSQSSRNPFDELFSEGFSGFGSFFDSPLFGSQKKTIAVTSDPLSLTVKPFPEKGRPSSFSGAVGNFTVSAQATPDTVKVGDPISLRVEVSGRGSMRSINPPVIQKPDGLKTYEPSVESATESQKVFEQVIVVRDSSVSAIPPVELAYFDPATEQYQIASSAPIPIVVSGEPATTGASPAEKSLSSTGGSTLDYGPESPDGLLFIKKSPGMLVPWNDPLRSSAVSVLGIAAASLLLVASLSRSALQKRIKMRNHDQQQAAVYDAAMKVISRLQSESCATGTLSAIEEARKAVISCLNAAQEATDGMPRHDVDDILRRLDSLRYSPSTPSEDEVKEALSRCNQVIQRLSSVRGRTARPSGLTAGALLLFGLAALAFSHGQAAASSTDDLVLECFYRGNAHYESGEYELAADSYEEAIGYGNVSGNLLFNLGNAYAKTGRNGEALLSYVRACEFIPRDEGLRHNIEVLSSALGLADIPRAGTLLSIVRTFTQSEWAHAAVLAYVLFSLLVALRLLQCARVRPPLMAIVVTGCILVSVTSGAVYRRSLYLGDSRTVVIADEASVRFEPGASAQVRYRVVSGQILSAIDASASGFLMVQDSAGQTGWIERSAVSSVRFGDK